MSEDGTYAYLKETDGSGTPAQLPGQGSISGGSFTNSPADGAQSSPIADVPVGDYGKGVTKVYELMKEAGVPVKMKLYKGCRHEILNDSSREEVTGDILEFIKS